MYQTNELKLAINREDERTFGPCACCGNLTRRVWGYVYEDETPRAAYFVEWTPGHRNQPASFDLIIGEWGEGTSAVDRVSVALDCRVLETRPAFMVVNAADRPVASSRLVGSAMAREQAVGTELEKRAFAICDAVLQGDQRLATLLPIKAS